MPLNRKHIPNILTIVRILLVPVIVVFILVDFGSTIYSFTILKQDYTFNLNYLLAGVLFVVACITDALDGYLARRNK
jgi:CDP-diacylglycerol--glycerol-3-phosphate 3-phosphatidyltransferase